MSRRAGLAGSPCAERRSVPALRAGCGSLTRPKSPHTEGGPGLAPASCIKGLSVPALRPGWGSLGFPTLRAAPVEGPGRNNNLGCSCFLSSRYLDADCETEQGSLLPSCSSAPCRRLSSALCPNTWKAAISKMEKNSSLLPQRAGQEALDSIYSIADLD